MRVDNWDVPPEVPPIQTEPRDRYFADYDNMHSERFSGIPPCGESRFNAVRGPTGRNLVSLVQMLARLHFTTKGRIGEDGKFELIFCSPEPVVVQDAPKVTEPVAKVVQLAEQPKPEIRYIEAKRPHEGHSHRRRHRTLF